MHAGEASGESAVRTHPIPSPENDITGGRLPAKMAGGLRIRMRNNNLRLPVDGLVDEAGILMAEAVVILTPDMGGKQIVQRGNRSAPEDVVAPLEPPGVLVEHGVDDVDEGFVAGEEAVAAGEQVAFEPAFALDARSRSSRHHRRAGKAAHLHSTFDWSDFRPFDAEACHQPLLIKNEGVGIVL